MKTKKMLALLAGMLLISGTAFAFHDGGVAHCDGCHSMHNSADNPRAGSATSAMLMKGSDASSTCLNCHDGSGRYHINSAVGDNMNQGGDFFWVKPAAAYAYYPGHGSSDVVAVPDNHGHNVVAADFSMAADATNTTAPGGSMTSNLLGCTSCHDPHGQVAGGTAAGTAAISVSGSYGAADPTDGSIHGNYRILGDAGFKNITAAAPVARANSYDGLSVDYGSGMSSWCLSCHPNFNDSANMHPVNVTVPGEYNSYVATGNYTGDVTTAYDALVPFETGETDGSLLKDVSTGIENTTGVDGSSQVMCLSCHRAHASAFDNALRWDDGAAFLAESGIFEEATAIGTPTTLMADGAVPYYKDGVAIDQAAMVAEYGEWQRSLCNKCHVKD